MADTGLHRASCSRQSAGAGPIAVQSSMPLPGWFVPRWSKSLICCAEQSSVLAGQDTAERWTEWVRGGRFNWKEDLRDLCSWHIPMLSGAFQHKLTMDQFICAQWIWAHRPSSARGFQEHSLRSTVCPGTGCCPSRNTPDEEAAARKEAESWLPWTLYILLCANIHEERGILTGSCKDT